MPVNSMARPASSAAAMTSSSRIEPPGWITAVAPASTAASRPSANGKKASEATAEPIVRGFGPAVGLGRFDGFRRGDARAVAAVHLAGADAGGGAVLGIDDGVGLDVLGDGPGEQAVGDFLLGRLALGDAFELVAGDAAVVAVLDQQPAGDHRQRLAGARRIGQLAGQQQAQILLLGEDGAGVVVGVGRDDDFGEDLRDRFGGRRRRAGGWRRRSRRTPRRCRRRAPRARPRPELSALRDAARVGVLDDDDRRRGRRGTRRPGRARRWRR